MNHMHDTEGHAASCTRLTNGLVKRKASCGSPAAEECNGKSAEESNVLLFGSQPVLCFSARAFPLTQDC